jgi:hypothetical protein
MAFSFPTSPTLNQEYTFGTKTWRFNGTGWVLVTGVDAAQSAWSTANLAYVNSNAATVLAQGAFDTANSKFDKAGGTISGNVFISRDLSVSGNLSVLGNTFSVNAGSIVTNDTLLIMGKGNYVTDALDIGFVSHYNDGVNAHTGLIRDSGTKEWNLFKGYTPEISANNNININDPSFTIDTLNADVHSSTVLIKTIDILPYANSIYDKTNAAFNSANSGFFQANSGFIQANAAYAQANAAYTSQNATGQYANSAFIHANSAYQSQNATGQYANSAFVAANSAGVYANAAFAAANAAGSLPFVQFAANTANAAFIRANNSLNANVGGTVTGNVVVIGNVVATAFETSGPAGDITGANAIFANYIFGANGSIDLTIYANNAYANANAGFVKANGAYNHANAAFLQANLAFTTPDYVANSAASYANSAFITANSAFTYGNATANYANSAFVQANAAFLQANTPDYVANSAASYANSAFATANSASVYANSAFTAANVADSKAVASGNYANGAFIQANVGITHAQSAFFQANSAYESQNATGQYANSAFIQANAAFDHANASFAAANNVFPQIQPAFNTANAAFIRANNSLNANVGGSITGDVRIAGNLIVTGNTVYANVQTLLIADNILTLNAAIDQTSAPTMNAGIEIDRGNQPNVGVIWNESTQKWTFTNDGTTYSDLGSGSGSAGVYANGAFIQANAAYDHANAAFNQANVGGSVAITFGPNPPASGNANGHIWIDSDDGTEYIYFKDSDGFQWVEFGPGSANIVSNTFITANVIAPFSQANAAYNQANAAFIQANASFDTGNSGFIQANAAFIRANTPSTTANAAFNHANAAFVQANTANTLLIDSTRLAPNLKLNIIQVLESANIFTTAIGGNVNIDIGNNTSYFFSSNTIANVTFNLRGTSSASFDSTVGIGQTASVAIALKQGAIKYRANVYIDGVLQTPYWLGNSSPSFATSQQQSFDVYTYTVFKTAASTYSILAANSNFGLAQGQPGQG